MDQTPVARVWVISGPTAVGKGTVVAQLRQRHPEIMVSCSATTRQPRPGEIEGRDYFFVSEDDFDRMIEEGQLLEWALVHGSARYGTPRGPVEAAAAAGKTVILEIELQGAMQVRQTMPGASFVFLSPPSWDELVRRLVGRGTETPQQRERRLATARIELAHADDFDYVVVNDELDTTVDRLVLLIGL